MAQLLGHSVGGLLVAFGLAAVAVPALCPLARRLGWVDRPNGRKAHAKATPHVGGVAIALAMIAGAAIARQPLSPGLVAGVAIMIVAGWLDDRLDLRWQARFLLQGLAVSAMVLLDDLTLASLGGGLGGAALAPLVGLPLTVVLALGFINAMNMIDGLDGLAGGMAAAGLLVLGAAAAALGDIELLSVFAVAFGAVAAFLAYNARFPGRPAAMVFLGNSGSEMLGLVLAWGAFKVVAAPDQGADPALLGFIIAPALIDCVVLLVRRPLSGRSPFQADRGHFHHLLLDAGWSVNGVVLLLCGAGLLLGLAAVAFLWAGAPPLLLLLAFATMAGGLFWVTADDAVRARLDAFRRRPQVSMRGDAS